MIGSGKQHMRRVDASIHRAAQEYEAEQRAQRDAAHAARKQAERDRVRLTREDIDGATAVRIKGSALWHKVRGVNTTTVTVWDYDVMGTGYWRRVPFGQVLGVRR